MVKLSVSKHLTFMDTLQCQCFVKVGVVLLTITPSFWARGFAVGSFLVT